MNSLFEAHRDKIENLYLYEGANFAAPHFHHHVEILYGLDDGLPVTINKTVYTLNKDETIIFDSFDVHGFSNPQNLRSISLVIPWKLNKDYIKKMEHMRFECPLVKDPKCNRIILQLLRILQENTTNIYTKYYTITTYDVKIQTFLQNIVSAIINAIFCYTNRVKTTNSAPKEQFQKILMYIEENYSEQISLTSLAEKFGYSACYFSKIWKNTFHCGCLEYINSVRLEKIIEHYTPNESLTNLAISHGFNSLRTMERTFKRNYDISPREFFND